AGKADRGIDSDVVALRRALSDARSATAASATTAGSGTTASASRTIGILDAILSRARRVGRRSGEVLEDMWLAHAVRLLRMGDRHLDYFDPECRGIRAILRGQIGASAELTFGPHAGRS